MYPLQMLAKCPLAKCPLTKRPLAKCPLAICPGFEKFPKIEIMSSWCRLEVIFDHYFPPISHMTS